MTVMTVLNLFFSFLILLLPVIGSEKTQQKEKDRRVVHHGHKWLTIFEEFSKVPYSMTAVEKILYNISFSLSNKTPRGLCCFCLMPFNQLVIISLVLFGPWKNAIKHNLWVLKKMMPSDPLSCTDVVF